MITMLYRYINTIWEGFQTMKRNCQTNSCKTVQCLHGISTGACVEKDIVKKRGTSEEKKIIFPSRVTFFNDFFFVYTSPCGISANREI